LGKPSPAGLESSPTACCVKGNKLSALS
jgi:hypothetical protein